MTQESEDLALPTWPTCIARGCAGVRVEGRKACLAHVDGRTRKGILASLRPGTPLDLRGTPVSAELLGSILRAMRAKDGTAVLGKAQFERAQFTGYAAFDRVQFTGDAWFTGSQFARPASFFGARFLGDAWFDQVLFASKADFARARFRGSSVFIRSQFITDVSFQDASFTAGAWYDEAQFAGDTWFTWAKFGGQYATFYKAQFVGTIAFVGARFAVEYTSFTEARFKQRGILGPMCATGFLELDRTVFEGDIHIEALGPSMLCRDTQYQETATVLLRHAELVLDGSLFTNPSTISFAPDPFKSLVVTGKQESVLPGIELFKEVETERGQQDARPRLLSLRGVDTATLTLTDVDLGACLFAGAHHLDQLRIEGPRPFADSPPGWHRGRVGGHGLPVWRWTRRQTLAEEHQWRAGLPLPRLPSGRPDPKQAEWYPPSCQTPPWVAARTDQQVKPLSPDRLVLLYRSLRKAQEDSKNEPGAADFYYGEMEMRRAALPRWRAERFLLGLYWLVSGYALRASRALATLALLVIVIAGSLALWGLPATGTPSGTATITGQPPSQQATITFPAATPPEPPRTPLTARLRDRGRVEKAVRTALSAVVFRDPGQQLTVPGRYIEMVARFTGPVLLALALLSVRNRVKR